MLIFFVGSGEDFLLSEGTPSSLCCCSIAGSGEEYLRLGGKLCSCCFFVAESSNGFVRLEDRS